MNEFFKILEIIIFFAIGYVYRDAQIIKKMIFILDKMRRENRFDSNEIFEHIYKIKLDEVLPEKNTLVVNEILHEKIKNNHYFYDQKGNFVAQGLELNDAAKNYALNNGQNNIVFFKNTENGKYYMFSRNKCIEVVDDQPI